MPLAVFQEIDPKRSSRQSTPEVFKGFYNPSFPGGLTDLIFIIMANIGTTITP